MSAYWCKCGYSLIWGSNRFKLLLSGTTPPPPRFCRFFSSLICCCTAESLYQVVLGQPALFHSFQSKFSLLSSLIIDLVLLTEARPFAIPQSPYNMLKHDDVYVDGPFDFAVVNDQKTRSRSLSGNHFSLSRPLTLLDRSTQQCQLDFKRHLF